MLGLMIGLVTFAIISAIVVKGAELVNANVR